ncbi:RNA polymerase sigma factor [Patescibacteria group bacterium]|nr:RNA polymerase sigma factor [Patescibacteria group bacterium]
MVTKDLQNPAILSLVAKAKEGDTESFSKIYEHFFEPVYRYAALRVPQEAAEDLVSDIFVKAWEKLHTYKERKNVPFGAWLFRIARNEVIDAYRTTKTWEEVPEDLSDTDEFNRADTSTKKLYILQIVRKAMDKLPKRYREVLSLSFIVGLRNSEVAQTLKITEGSVRILKFRALQKLKENLPPEFEENL